MIANIWRALREPGVEASLAALLAAVGIEVPDIFATHVLEILAALVAILGIVLGIAQANGKEGNGA
jgi:hypothetical protein